MLTPIDLKTIAELETVYPRDVVFYALIQAIVLKQKGSDLYARLYNDPGDAYASLHDSHGHMSTAQEIDFEIDETKCRWIDKGFTKDILFGKGDHGQCSYAKFKYLLHYLIVKQGLDVELGRLVAISSG